MECERLNRLVRSWYVQVQDEALAPARMVEFMEKHLEDCDVCLADPDVRHEVKKITEIVLPPSKMTKVVKAKHDEAEEESAEAAEDEEVAEVDEDEVEDDELDDGNDIDSSLVEED